MSIVLLVLKIIGILLFTLLCLILLVLFHPIFYQVEGEANEKTSVQGYFWWLFQILRLEFRWEEQDVSVKLRVFGFSGNSGEKETKEDPFESGFYGYETEKAGAKEESGTGKVREEEESRAEKSRAKEESETEKVREEEESGTEKSGKDEEYRTEKMAEAEDAKENPIVKQASDSGKKRKRKIKTNQKKRKGKEEGGIQARFNLFRQEAADERNRQAIAHLWWELCYLLSHVKPGYIKAEISFSTGDPALTGKVTGALSLFPVIYRYDTHIYPDFLSDAFYIKGSFKMKGRIAIFHFLIVLIRLFLDKKVKRLYHVVRDGI